jgi:hypothetical protein
MIPARAGSVHRTQTRNRPLGSKRRPGDFHFAMTSRRPRGRPVALTGQTPLGGDDDRRGGFLEEKQTLREASDQRRGVALRTR